MAKTTGPGMAFYVAGNDLSGDINSLGKISGGPLVLDVTDITQSAISRLGGERDAGIDFVSYFDPTGAHPYLSSLPVADAIGSVLVAPLAIGSPMASLQGRQIGYDPTRGTDGSLTLATSLTADAFGLEWGEQLTPGKRTDSAATNGASIDDSAGATTPAVPGSGTPVSNTSPISSTVVISGGTMTQVIVNGVQVGTGAGTYVVPGGGGTIQLTYTVAPTWTWTYQTGYGAQGYLQLFAITGTSVDVAIQTAPDNATWTTLIDFGAQSAAGAFRGSVSNVTNVAKWVRVITTGTFSNAVFAVQFTRNLIPGVVF